MKNVYSFLVLSIIIMLAVSVTSCKKDIVEPIKPIEKDNITQIGHLKSLGISGILIFSDNSDLSNTIDSVRNLTHDELVYFETSMGYSSWGRACEDLYNAIDSADLKDDSLLVSNHVNSNSEYLLLIEDGHNEFVYETRFSGLPQYEIMNENRMYIVNDTVYKIFDSGILLANIDSYYAMLSIDEKDLDDYMNDDNYIFLEQDNTYKTGGDLKDTSYD